MSASTQGQMLAGLRAARAQLDAMNERPQQPLAKDSDLPTPPPVSDGVEDATKTLGKALQRRGAHAVRVWAPGATAWWASTYNGAEPSAPEDALSLSQWSLATELIGGALGRQVLDHGAKLHGLSPLDGVEPESEVLISTAHRYLFGRVLPRSGCHLLVSCEKVPTIIGPMTSSIRRHRDVRHLDDVLAPLVI